MRSSFVYRWKTYIVLCFFLIQVVACGSKDGLTDGSAATIIEKQVLENIFNSGVPVGSVSFMNGFEASMSNENLKTKKYHPRRLELAKKLSEKGLLSLVERSSVFDMLAIRYDITITPVGEKR